MLGNFWTCSNLMGLKEYQTRRAVTNVVRTCGPTHLLIFDFMSNKICLKQPISDVVTGDETLIYMFGIPNKRSNML